MTILYLVLWHHRFGIDTLFELAEDEASAKKQVMKKLKEDGSWMKDQDDQHLEVRIVRFPPGCHLVVG